MKVIAETVGQGTPALERQPGDQNNLYIIGGDPAGVHNPFEHTENLTLASDPKRPATASCFARHNHLHRWHDSTADVAIYSWGMVRHATNRDPDSLLHWVAGVVAKDELTPLRELLGTFVIVIDDRRKRELTIINDPMGLRPLYTGTHGGRFVAGSDVLAICGAGLSDNEPDYDAIAAWIRYNQPVDGQSVVTDYRHLPAACVRTVDSTGKILRDRTYGPLPFDRIETSQENVIEHAFNATSHSLTTQLRGHAEINFPLTGGYDSRLLFAIASTQGKAKLYAATLATREIETMLATQIATAMHHPLEILRAKPRILDLFDDPFCFTSGGFITGRNLTSKMARRHRGMPLVSGYLGDGTMRGSLLASGNAHFAKDDENLSIDDLLTSVDKRFIMHKHRANLMFKPLQTRLAVRAKRSMRSFVETAIASTKPMLYCDLLCRQRFYYGSVFLQHLSVAEAITPYASWDVLASRVRYAVPLHNEKSYPELFNRHFPQLAHIPHSLDKEKLTGPTPPTPATRHLRRWSADVAAALIVSDLLGAFKKRTLVGLLPKTLLGETEYQDEITFTYKMLMFERAMRRNHVRFDWNKL